jgi:hypothetical protein
MNSRSRSAAWITGPRIAPVTNAAWWKATGIDPIRVARGLWKHTRVEEGRVPPDAITPAARIPDDYNRNPIFGRTNPTSRARVVGTASV